MTFGNKSISKNRFGNKNVENKSFGNKVTFNKKKQSHSNQEHYPTPYIMHDQGPQFGFFNSTKEKPQYSDLERHVTKKETKNEKINHFH